MDESLCWKMQQLADSLLLKMITIARIVLSVIGFIFMIMLMKFGESHRRLHRNAKFLLILHYIATIGLSVAYFINYTYSIILLMISTKNSCDRLMTVWTSFHLHAIALLFVLLQMTSIFAIAIERTAATILYKSYEKDKSIVLPAILIALQIIIAVGIPYGFLARGLNWSEMSVGPTVVFSCNRRRNQIFTVTFVIFEFIMALYIHLLLYSNYIRRKLTWQWNSESDLSERYQIDENIRALHFIIRFLWLHIIFNCTAGTVAFITIVLNNNLNFVESQILDRIGFLNLYAIVLFILIFSIDPTMRCKIKKYIAIRDVKVASSTAFANDTPIKTPNNMPHFITQESTKARFDQFRMMLK
ncbi:unnamed protein product [Dracunculus medinensis]|uniref:G_PROTEIN_RECEP_F1_2 domain-containing protein n=1 Tax=Dracunculus medinensis TaxID=318479 RepID=A0A158Q2I7_DRAME|nr:unnamed protein product [Dracunculus medinensis]